MAGEMSARKKMTLSLNFYAIIVFYTCLVCSNKASEILRPRGVSISKASLYIPDADFRCFDSSNVIPFSQVNDDYCDCSDGSDEPGTAACPNSFFHCTNAGFRPLNIPSSQVNDGICDCCDGADEYIGKHCENTCLVLGKAERLEAQKRAEIAKTGNEGRLDASKKGKLLKQEKSEKYEQLEKDLQEAESIRQEKEKIKAAAEELERVALDHYKPIEEEDEGAKAEDEAPSNEEEAQSIFTLMDSNGDGKIDLSELKVRQTFDQNKDGVISDDEAKYFLAQNEEVDFAVFFERAWPLMKPFFMLDKGLFKPPAKGTERDEDDKGVGSVEDVTQEYLEERHHTEDTDEGELEGDEEEEEEEEEDGAGDSAPLPQLPTAAEEEAPKYDAETQGLVDAARVARGDLEDADRTVRDIQREMSQLQEYLQKDFGPEEEFAPLEGECFEYTDREYIYKLCPFDHASQRSKSGGADTRLGVWQRWSGPADNKYSGMLYEKGQACWNGPQRSTQVSVKCGLENAVVAVSEPNKCEYHMDFTTPSACRVSEAQDSRQHDEL